MLKIQIALFAAYHNQSVKVRVLRQMLNEFSVKMIIPRNVQKSIGKSRFRQMLKNLSGNAQIRLWTTTHKYVHMNDNMSTTGRAHKYITIISIIRGRVFVHLYVCNSDNI